MRVSVANGHLLREWGSDKIQRASTYDFQSGEYILLVRTAYKFYEVNTQAVRLSIVFRSVYSHRALSPTNLEVKLPNSHTAKLALYFPSDTLLDVQLKSLETLFHTSRELKLRAASRACPPSVPRIDWKAIVPDHDTLHSRHAAHALLLWKLSVAELSENHNPYARLLSMKTRHHDHQSSLVQDSLRPSLWLAMGCANGLLTCAC